MRSTETQSDAESSSTLIERLWRSLLEAELSAMIDLVEALKLD